MQAGRYSDGNTHTDGCSCGPIRLCWHIQHLCTASLIDFSPRLLGLTQLFDLLLAKVLAYFCAFLQRLLGRFSGGKSAVQNCVQHRHEFIDLFDFIFSAHAYLPLFAFTPPT